MCVCSKQWDAILTYSCVCTIWAVHPPRLRFLSMRPFAGSQYQLEARSQNGPALELAPALDMARGAGMGAGMGAGVAAFAPFEKSRGGTSYIYVCIR